MPANNSLNLVDLDFAFLKNSLKTYLQGQPFLSDYDFEGSNLNVLLDLLVYNTQKNAFFLNMNIAESFLDSAQLRDSILSHAKNLNYTPRSARSARATVTLSFEATQESQPYVIPKGSSFTSFVKNESYIFSIPEVLILSSANTTYTTEIDIYEGVYLKDTYIFASDEENQRFRISNRNVDTESLTVTVYEDNVVVGDEYTLATSLLDVDATDKVFFLQASENGYYEVLFGNGIIGRKPKRNATITLDYRVSSATKANGARTFIANFDPTGAISELTNTPTVTTEEAATGGADPESNESIRYIAPRHFQVQERAVIESDAEVLLRTQFPEINAVSVFGGDKVDPPRFGKLFVSVDISDVDGLPDFKKREYENFLRRRCNLSIRPIIIEPEFSYVDIDTLVRYNVNTGGLSEDNIRTLVVSAISEYNENFLDDFSVTLRYSALVELISDLDESIVSNITRVQLYKKVSPELLVAQNLDIDFAIELLDEFSLRETSYSVNDRTCITSTAFRFQNQNVLLADDGNGNLRLVKNDGTTVTKVADIGTVDYTSGLLQLTNFFVQDYDGSHIKVFARPADVDITAAQNTILSIEPDRINVEVELLNV